MNVAIVNSFFPSWRGGAESYVYNLSRALIERRHRITILLGNQHLPHGVSFSDGLTVKRPRILAGVYGTPIMPYLLGELGHVRPDILQANFRSPTLMGAESERGFVWLIGLLSYSLGPSQIKTNDAILE